MAGMLYDVKDMLNMPYFIILCFIIAISGHESFADESVIELPIIDTAQIITQTGVEIDRSNEANGGESLLIDAAEPMTVELFELHEQDFSNKRLTYKAQLRSKDLTATEDSRGISYLELLAKFPDGEELVSRGPRVPISGTQDWTAANAVLYVDKGGAPESVKLNLVVEGRGKVWLDSVKLEAIPLRLDYLFWGHIVVWVVLIIYIYSLLRKNRQLKRELETVKH